MVQRPFCDSSWMLLQARCWQLLSRRTPLRWTAKPLDFTQGLQVETLLLCGVSRVHQPRHQQACRLRNRRRQPGRSEAPPRWSTGQLHNSMVTAFMPAGSLHGSGGNSRTWPQPACMWHAGKPTSCHSFMPVFDPEMLHAGSEAVYSAVAWL